MSYVHIFPLGLETPVNHFNNTIIYSTWSLYQMIFNPPLADTELLCRWMIDYNNSHLEFKTIWLSQSSKRVTPFQNVKVYGYLSYRKFYTDIYIYLSDSYKNRFLKV